MSVDEKPNDPSENIIDSELDNQEDPKERSELEFWTYGVFTFWILPAIFFLIYFSNIGIWILVSFIVLLYTGLRQSDLPGQRLFFFLSRWTFGAKLDKPKAEIVRVWWFVTFGSLLTGLIILGIIFSAFLVVPILVILYYRKRVLRYLYFITFLPRREYVNFETKEERQQRQQRFEQYLEMDRQFMVFLKPKFTTYFFGYLLIFLSPFLLALLIIPVSLFFSGTGNITQNAISTGVGLSFVGIIGIIPYLIILFPLWRDRRLTRLVSTKLASNIISTITGHGLNNLPMLDGEYFIEKESKIIDMSRPMGFFEIFKRGRFVTIFLIPIALISLILRFTVFQVTETTADKLTVETFFSNFTQLLGQNNVVLLLLFIVPIFLTILLPLIFVLNDAEIKRSKWRKQDIVPQTTSEIHSVEDVGQTINNIIKIVLGVGAITNLSSSIALVFQQASTLDAYLISSIVIIFGAELILPGVLFMVFQHFAYGDHSIGVNYIRYIASSSDQIAVGTINRSYDPKIKLENPPEEVLQIDELQKKSNLETAEKGEIM